MPPALDLEIVRQIVGQEFDHATHGPVTAEELIAFARALGETRPEYTEPGPDLIGHPTYCVRYKGRKFYPENLPKVVKFLASKGAKIEIWNQPDKFGWTPLAIAVGYRFGNFKPSPDTEAAVRAVMIAAGVTPPKVVTAKTQQIY